MNVLLGSKFQHIEGSPFLSTISASDMKPDFTWIYGSGLSYAEAGLSSNVYVQVRAHPHWQCRARLLSGLLAFKLPHSARAS